MGRDGGRFVVLAVIGLAAVSSARAEANDDADLADFVAMHRCEVVSRLQRIHAAPRPKKSEHDSDGRYLIVASKFDASKFIQCIFLDERRRMLCEAASGFFAKKNMRSEVYHLSPGQLGALARLGFSTDASAGNYTIQFPLGEPPNFKAAAELMLRTLYLGYGIKSETPLEWSAPFARRRSLDCTPSS
jgi:hypothetical protein